jgi:hypothetical protein
MSLLDSANQPIRDNDKVYQYLVPAAYREQLQDTGVIGGLSIAVSGFGPQIPIPLLSVEAEPSKH